MKSSRSYFSPEFFKFLKALARHNNREWFLKNNQIYEKSVFTPILRFIKDGGKELKGISAYLVADPRPFGGSLFRIYRDIRFSRDKSPYKTNVAMKFWHRRGGKKPYTGLYLNLAPRESFVGADIWHPDAPTLNRSGRPSCLAPRHGGGLRRAGRRWRASL